MMGLFGGILKGVTDQILGPDPQEAASAYQQLQDAMSSRYNQQKQAFEADPANSGQKYQMPDALTRWQDQINGMITSGNPILQQQGLQQLGAYQQRATAAQSGPDMTAAAKDYQLAVQQGYKGSFMDYKKELASMGRSSVSVNVGGPSGIEGINFLSAADKERLHLPQNTGYYVDKNGQIKEPPGGADLATQQQTNVTKAAIDETDKTLFSKGGLYDTTDTAVGKMNIPDALKRPAGAGYAFAQQYVQNDPRYASQAAINSNLAASIGRSYLGEKGVMTDEDAARIKSLLPDPVKDNRDTAQRKMNYIKKIVQTSDPTKVRDMVYSSDDKSSPKDAASWSQTKSGHKYRIVE